MAADTRIPVALLTGFLGSGKTTLLNRLLRAPAMADTAVVVNELGDIGLDHPLVAGPQPRPDDNIVLLNAGCLCCGMLNGFKETLAELYERRARAEIPAFRRVIVETTGLADPGPVLQTLLRDSFVAHFYRLAGVVTTVDALHAVTTLDQHPESVAQVAVADLLAVTKTDLTGGAVPPEAAARITRINPHAAVVPATAGEAPAPLLVDVLAGADNAAARSAGFGHDRSLAHHAHAHHPHAHHAGDVRADSFVLSGPVSWADLSQWIAHLRSAFGARLLRCKGLVEIAGTGRPALVQGVQTVFAPPQLLASWPDQDHRSRVICIVKGIPPERVRASLGVLSAPSGGAPTAPSGTIASLSATP